MMLGILRPKLGSFLPYFTGNLHHRHPEDGESLKSPLGVGMLGILDVLLGHFSCFSLKIYVFRVSKMKNP